MGEGSKYTISLFWHSYCQNFFFICRYFSWLDKGSIKQGNLFYLSSAIIVRTFHQILRRMVYFASPSPNNIRVQKTRNTAILCLLFQNLIDLNYFLFNYYFNSINIKRLNIFSRLSDPVFDPVPQCFQFCYCEYCIQTINFGIIHSYILCRTGICSPTGNS